MTRASRSSAGIAPPMCSAGISKGPGPGLALPGMTGMLGTNCAGLPLWLAACTCKQEHDKTPLQTLYDNAGDCDVNHARSAWLHMTLPSFQKTC